MLRNVSILIKLLAGFGAVVLLLVLVLVSGMGALSGSSQGFTDYRGLARDANLAGRLQANLLIVRLRVKDYILSGSDEHLAAYRERWEAMRGFMDEAQEEIQKPERAELVDKADEHFAEYGSVFKEVVDLINTRHKLVATMDALGPEMRKAVSNIMETAYRDDDVYAAYYAGLAQQHLMLGRLYAAKFLTGNDPADADRVVSEFNEMQEVMQNLDAELQNPERRAWLADAIAKNTQYVTTFKEVVETILTRNEKIAKGLDRLGPVIAEDLEQVKLSVIADQDALGPRLQAANDASIRTMTVAGLVAAAFALGIALLLGLTTARSLRRVAAFADAVAGGDFGQELDIRGKDEIGRLAASIRGIPHSIGTAVDAFRGMAKDVGHGRLNARGDASALSGGFADLIHSANHMADAYTQVVDSFPFPVLSLDTDSNILFINKQGASLGGRQAQDMLGSKCYDHLKTGDCQTENCACSLAMNTLKAQEGETKAEIGSSMLDIKYIGTPITVDGQVVGAFEYVIDQTELKQATEQMLDVAARAEEIAERVSSAATELSSQVDEITRGAQVQQERITETVTSMEEMNATVLEVARNAGSAANEGEAARDKATEGARVVEQAVAAIGRVSRVAETLKVSTDRLGVQAESIGQVMNVISDIADQTNLLALNAAIEAARAGDAGRGFAVVADEVRKLAEKTMQATKEVGDSIGSIQEATRENIRSMEEAGAAVAEATELSNRSGLALKEIVELVASNAQQISGIATASEEQSAASEEINSAVEEINRITMETAEGMLESNNAVQELSQMAAQLRQVMSGLKLEV